MIAHRGIFPTMWSIEREHLERAVRAVTGHVERTPLAPAPMLGEGAYFKHEHAQRTGSFKLRGAIAALDAMDPAVRARGVITASAGNHGAGLALAGAIFGAPVTVFVGREAPAIKREKIASAGAIVRVLDVRSYDDVEAHAKEEAARLGLAFVSPFDDPVVAAGNGGTLGLEILDDLPEVRAIVAPVGGGGLVAGLAAAIAERRSQARLIGVQSEACPSMLESLRLGRALTRYEGAPTLAEGLEGGVSESTYTIAARALDRMEVVSEEAIADAMKRGITIEGSAAVSLAWALANDAPRPFVVVLTGCNVSPLPPPDPLPPSGGGGAERSGQITGE